MGKYVTVFTFGFFDSLGNALLLPQQFQISSVRCFRVRPKPRNARGRFVFIVECRMCSNDRRSVCCCRIIHCLQSLRHNHRATQAEHEKSWSCGAYLLQSFLHSTLDCLPTTAGSAQFCLLCCQPEPVPESLPARPPSLTRRCPCSLPVWSGQSIHMVCRTYSSPRHSISPTPLRGTEKCDPPQI